MLAFVLVAAVLIADPATGPASAPTPIDATEPPWSGRDYSWMNGTNRQPASLLGLGPVTLAVYADLFYAWQFSAPVDHTIFETTVAPRHNEVGVNLASVG